jgi:hypothetical protein
MVFGGRFLTIALFMPFWSDDLFFFSFLTTEKTFPGDIGDAGSVIGRGEKIMRSVW